MIPRLVAGFLAPIAWGTRRVCAGLVCAILTGCATVAPGPVVVAPADAGPLVQVLRPGRAVVGLALGGGALRGFAHIGILKVLEAAGVTADLVVGTSVGAVVGALHAAGLPADAVEKATDELDWSVFGHLVVPRLGLVGGERIEEFINRHVGYRPIEALAMPFAAVATDAQNGLLAVFNRGNTGMAVRASASVPVVFQPVRIGSREYIDGTLVSPVPIATARAMGADVVIAVNVTYRPTESRLRTPLDMLFQTVQIMAHTINTKNLREADVLIDAIPPGSAVSLANRAAVIRAGEDAARAALPQIRAVLSAASARRDAER